MIDTNKIWIIATISFVLGFIGAWINFGTEYRKTCPLTWAACRDQFFDIFFFCFCGGVVSLVNCWPPAGAQIQIAGLLPKALGSGFAFLSILEQFKKGSIEKVIIETGKKAIDQTPKNAIKKAQAFKEEDLKELLKIANELANGKEPPEPEINDEE